MHIEYPRNARPNDTILLENTILLGKVVLEGFSYGLEYLSAGIRLVRMIRPSAENKTQFGFKVFASRHVQMRVGSMREFIS